MEREVLRPEHKHGEAIAMRQGDIDVTSLPLYTTIMGAIKESQALVETAPVTLYGVPTQEYCIVPCLYNDQESSVMKVLQRLRGDGWFADLFRMSESVDNPDKYRFAVLVCWDPRVISASFSPRFYSIRDVGRLPCGVCAKHRTSGVDSCTGCAIFKMWLAGVAGMKTWEDPCKVCHAKRSKSASQCKQCPARRLWERRKKGDFGDGKGIVETAVSQNSAPQSEQGVQQG